MIHGDVAKMKKFAIIVLTLLFSVSSLFAMNVKTAMADLDSEDEAKVVAAADYLGSKGEASAIPRLSELTTDSRTKVRLHSVMALGYIKKSDAVEALNGVLVNEKDAGIRYAALLATVRIGSKKSDETLKQITETETDPMVKDLLDRIEKKAEKDKKKK